MTQKKTTHTTLSGRNRKQDQAQTGADEEVNGQRSTAQTIKSKKIKIKKQRRRWRDDGGNAGEEGGFRQTNPSPAGDKGDGVSEGSRSTPTARHRRRRSGIQIFKPKYRFIHRSPLRGKRVWNLRQDRPVQTAKKKPNLAFRESPNSSRQRLV